MLGVNELRCASHCSIGFRFIFELSLFILGSLCLSEPVFHCPPKSTLSIGDVESYNEASVATLCTTCVSLVHCISVKSLRNTTYALRPENP